MKIRNRLFLICLIIVFSLTALMLAACNPGSGDDDGGKTPGEITETPGDNNGDGDGDGTQTPADKTVSKIEVASKPDKTIYIVGEKFDATGGKIKINYADGTTSELDFTAAGVELTAPSTSSVGTKNGTIKFGKKTVRFTITVVSAQYNVTFNYNYPGAPDDKTIKVAEGETADTETPTRAGYTFYNWYENADYTVVYDFAAPVKKDVTLYAFWKKDGAEYVDFTFDYDFYGKVLTAYTIPAEKGAPVAKPSDPVRTGYEFDGWYTDDTYATEYAFTANVTAATTVVAKWRKTVTGKQDYVFEAEDTDLSGKVGPSWSGTASEKSMIQYQEGLNASGNRWVGYLYEKDLSLEFYLASDIAVGDATLSANFSCELGTQTFNPGNYSVLVNGEALNYNAFTVETTGDTKALFRTVELKINVPLLKGANTIALVTNNNLPTQGTTFKAIAPMVDCIKINTSAVLTWDETKGLPAENYKK